MTHEQEYPQLSLEARYKQVIAAAKQYVAENKLPNSDKPSLELFAPQQYLIRIMGQAIEAAESGTYGIGAAVAVRYGGAETIFYGRNTIFSDRDPRGHAESNAIALTAQIANSKNDNQRRKLLTQAQVKGLVEIRSYPYQEDESKLDIAVYTTLEPCHKCTVEMLTANLSTTDEAGVTRTNVFIGAEDEVSGGMVGNRYLDKLYMEKANLEFSVWNYLQNQQGLAPVVGQSDNPAEVDTYVDPQLLRHTWDIFGVTREIIDAQLNTEGGLDRQGLIAVGALVSSLISGSNT